MKRHEVILRFAIWQFEDITHNELTEKVGVIPIKQYFKGERVNLKVPNGKISKSNGWLIEPPNFQQYDDFETQMQAFTKLGKEKYEVFSELCNKYLCEFSCAIFLCKEIEESTPWVHLGDSYNEVFGKLNIHFNLDLYH